MLHERIFLDPADDRVYIDTYIADDKSQLHDAMIVIPGGGYHNVCTDREGEPIALAYFAKGVNCFVLHYRAGLDGDTYPKQLIDASRAVLHIRENAEKYAVDPNRVFAVGFSAGGHLAGSLALLSDEPAVLSALNINAGDNTPNGVVLAYPVTTMNAPTHRGSFIHLAGKPFDEIDAVTAARLSLDNHVTKSSPPAFIWHTAPDTVVPIAGTFALAKAYTDAGVPMMMHVYPYGPHGLALASKITLRTNPESVQPLAEGWVDASLAFLKTV